MKAFVIFFTYLYPSNQYDSTMETYTHYGKQADVFKHLVLCEVLTNEKPSVYVDTNSACAVYQLKHTPEQEYGIYHFLRKASANGKLKDSCYYRLEHAAQQTNCYYGSPALAMKIVGKQADKYYFFDLNIKSLENVRCFAGQEDLEDRIRIGNCDSTKGVMDLLPALPEDSFLHIDPYKIDQQGINGHTYLDIFVAATGLGLKCLLWYGFMTLDDKQRLETYIVSCLQKSTIKNVTSSRLIMKNIGKDTISCNPGISGSGLLASNLSEKSIRQFLAYSRLLEDIYKDSHYKEYNGDVYNESEKL